MSESSEAYGRWYDRVQRVIDTAVAMVEEQDELVSPTERRVIADRARLAARRLAFVADTLELVDP